MLINRPGELWGGYSFLCWFTNPLYRASRLQAEFRAVVAPEIQARMTAQIKQDLRADGAETIWPRQGANTPEAIEVRAMICLMYAAEAEEQELIERFQNAVASIPPGVDIAEWLLEQGIELACSDLPGGRTGNCPMATWFAVVAGLPAVRVSGWAAYLYDVDSDGFGRRRIASASLPPNVTAFVHEFDLEDTF